MGDTSRRVAGQNVKTVYILQHVKTFDRKTLNFSIRN